MQLHFVVARYMTLTVFDKVLEQKQLVIDTFLCIILVLQYCPEDSSWTSLMCCFQCDVQMLAETYEKNSFRSPKW